MPELSDETLKRMEGVFTSHLEHSDSDLAAHVWRKRRALGEQVMRKRRIYLDLRFWILLRDAHEGRPQDESDLRLLELFREGVVDGSIVCPLNESSFLELLRQGDEARRMNTVRLMDELSQGIVIENTVDRVRTEIKHFLTESIRGTFPGPPLEEVWLKIGHVMGTPRISSQELSAKENLAAQKTLVDLLWSISLEEILAKTPIPENRRPRDEKLAVELTSRSKNHESELTSFSKLYEAELAGFWDVYEVAVGDTLVQLYDSILSEEISVSSEEKAEQTRLFKNALRNIVVLKDEVTALPTSQVVSGLHAIVRWNRHRGFKSTDFFDFHHAAAAVPYCDAFLTEAFMCTVLTQQPLSFATQFSCRVLSDRMEAIALLEDWSDTNGEGSNL